MLLCPGRKGCGRDGNCGHSEPHELIRNCGSLCEDSKGENVSGCVEMESERKLIPKKRKVL